MLKELFLQHPKGLGLLLFVELWERFSYYGMRSLLMLYMVRELHLSVAAAGQIYGLYTGVAYALPVLGGLLADRLLGERRAIGLGALLMAIGHFAMVYQSQAAFVCALALLVLGTGFFKANTATLVGKLYAEGDVRRDAGFRYFYLTVNIGAFSAPLVCGSLAEGGRWHLGFGVAGAGMLIGLVAWRMREHVLGDIGLPPARAAKALQGERRRAPMSHIERQRLLALAILAVLGNISLWAAIGQAGSSMALFADRETNLALPFFNVTLPASYLQAANPLFIILGVPLMAGVWRLAAKYNRMPTPPIQFAIGLLLVAVGFAILTMAGLRVDAGYKVSMAWLLLATLFNTCGELCVSPVGLSLVTKLAPARYTSAMMGMWYASIALANGLSGHMAGLYETVSKGQLFVMPACWALAMALLLRLLSKPLNRLLHGVC